MRTEDHRKEVQRLQADRAMRLRRIEEGRGTKWDRDCLAYVEERLAWLTNDPEDS